mmetsp:Transcript_12713/g.28850  ORF Transcript_12713/g.28850 Transcript_12713/m.28850 type:complete len:234 (+) Transcript_12713:660-1361(+)
MPWLFVQNKNICLIDVNSSSLFFLFTFITLIPSTHQTSQHVDDPLRVGDASPQRNHKRQHCGIPELVGLLAAQAHRQLTCGSAVEVEFHADQRVTHILVRNQGARKHLPVDVHPLRNLVAPLHERCAHGKLERIVGFLRLVVASIRLQRASKQKLEIHAVSIRNFIHPALHHAGGNVKLCPRHGSQTRLGFVAIVLATQLAHVSAKAHLKALHDFVTSVSANSAQHLLVSHRL